MAESKERAREPRAPLSRFCDRARVGLIVLFLCYNVLIVSLMIWLTPKNDFGRTFASAAAFCSGRPLYEMNDSIPWDAEGKTIYLYNLNPPHFHVLLLPLVPLGLFGGLLIWLVAEFASLYAVVRLVSTETGLPIEGELAERSLLAILAFAGTTSWLVTGHLAVFLALPVALACRAEKRGRPLEAGAWIGLVASIKFLFLIFVPYWVLKRRWKALAPCCAVFLACFGLGVVVFGVETSRSWLQGMKAANGWAYLPMNMSVLGVLTRLFRPSIYAHRLGNLSETTVRDLWLVISAILGASTIVIAAAARSARRVDSAYGLLLTAAILISPLGWLYYFWLPVAPILIYVLKRKPGLEVRSSRERLPLASRRLLSVALVCCVCPCLTIRIKGGEGLISALQGTLQFWGLLFTWLALAIDGAPPVAARARRFMRMNRWSLKSIRWIPMRSA